VVGAAARAEEVEAQPVEGACDGVFVVRADVDGFGRGEGHAGGVGEEGREVVVVGGARGD